MILQLHLSVSTPIKLPPNFKPPSKSKYGSDFCYLPEEFGKNSKITFLEVKAWGTFSGLMMKDCYSRIAKVWTDLKLFLNQQIFTENLGFIQEFVVQSILTRRKFVFQQIPGVQAIRLYYF